MAIYHFSVKTFSRSNGRSATAAIAYRAAEKIYCEREGRTHDYTRKTGVEHQRIFLPQDAPEHLWQREKLWNEVEQRETRKNSTVAREFEIAFPSELNQEQRQAMLKELCESIVERHQVAVDACIHTPHTGSGSDERNYHAHILMSTRRLTPEGFGAKTRELDQKYSGEVPYWRERFAEICNQHLERAGHSARVNHRSYKDQNQALEATLHEGPAVTQLRRQGIETELSRTNDQIRQRNQIRLAQHKNLDQLIAENEIELSRLKIKHQIQSKHSARTSPVDDRAAFKQKQAETLKKLVTGEISAKEADLDPVFMQECFQAADQAIQQHREQLSQFSKELAAEINQNNLKQSYATLKDLAQQYEELGQNKPLLFGKKAWEAQRQSISNEYRQLKQEHEHNQKHGISTLLEDAKFKKYAWKEYQNTHPEQADKYQRVSRSYPIIKQYVQTLQKEREQAQQLERRQQQAKEQSVAPKRKSRGISR